MAKLHLGKLVSMRAVLRMTATICTKMANAWGCACANSCGGPLELVPRSLAWEKEYHRAVHQIYEQCTNPDEYLEYMCYRRESVGLEPIVYLQEVKAPDDPSAWFPSKRSIGGTLGCDGDEAAICCPYALDENRELEVIARGRLHLVHKDGTEADPLSEDAAVNGLEYRLYLESICRITR